MSATSYARHYLDQVRQIAASLDVDVIHRILDILIDIRNKDGRIFFLGVGGGAGHASHAVNDFRKIAGIECYAPTDNVSELTARINDNGWDSCYADWLRVSRLSARDAVFVFSVGGGSPDPRVSMNVVTALQFASAAGARILGVVGRDGGLTARLADACVVVPTLSSETITPHAEEFQAVVWHLLVSHPRLRAHEMKWESGA